MYKKEYLILSLLSYLNIREEEIGKTCYEIFENIGKKEREKILFKILAFENTKFSLKYFEKELREYTLLDIEDRRATTSRIMPINISKSGFYSLTFKKENKVVIAFRGSEVFPFQEAYKDFIENNLVIGMGKRPQQFNDAVEVYEKHIKNGIDYKNIELTGHSLGGGMAEFVAVIINKRYDYIPKTITWSGIGINRKGMLEIQDFINYEEIRSKKNELLQFSFLSKKENNNILTIFKATYFKIINEFLNGKIEFENILSQNMKSNILLNIFLNRITLIGEEKKSIESELIETFFEDKELIKIIKDTKKFIANLDNSDLYKARVYNFGHSCDMTNNLFPHVGTSVMVDLKFEVKKTYSKNMVQSLFSNKSILDYHFENIFIPYFLPFEKDEIDMEECQLNIEYIASVVRKFLCKENGFKKELLFSYYSKEKINKENYFIMKSYLIFGINNSIEKALYKEEVIKKIDEMDLNEFTLFWEKTLDKLPSPYGSKDIFDSIVF